MDLGNFEEVTDVIPLNLSSLEINHRRFVVVNSMDFGIAIGSSEELK